LIGLAWTSNDVGDFLRHSTQPIGLIHHPYLLWWYVQVWQAKLSMGFPLGNSVDIQIYSVHGDGASTYEDGSGEPFIVTMFHRPLQMDWYW